MYTLWIEPEYTLFKYHSWPSGWESCSAMVKHWNWTHTESAWALARSLWPHVAKIGLLEIENYLIWGLELSLGQKLVQDAQPKTHVGLGPRSGNQKYFRPVKGNSKWPVILTAMLMSAITGTEWWLGRREGVLITCRTWPSPASTPKVIYNPLDQDESPFAGVFKSVHFPPMFQFFPISVPSPTSCWRGAREMLPRTTFLRLELIC